MFPISYKHKIEIEIGAEQKFDRTALLNNLKEQLDNPLIIGKNTISFDNFNTIFKRHKWLDNGELKISTDEKHIVVDLTLYFFTTPTILLIISIASIASGSDVIWFPIFGAVLLWTFFSLLYLWTSKMFKTTIKNVINRQLYLEQFVLQPDNIVIVTTNCPACGNPIQPTDSECNKCGINFESE